MNKTKELKVNIIHYSLTDPEKHRKIRRLFSASEVHRIHFKIRSPSNGHFFDFFYICRVYSLL